MLTSVGCHIAALASWSRIMINKVLPHDRKATWHDTFVSPLNSDISSIWFIKRWLSRSDKKLIIFGVEVWFPSCVCDLSYFSGSHLSAATLLLMDLVLHPPLSVATNFSPVCIPMPTNTPSLQRGCADPRFLWSRS